jgi:hypothetical protein
MSSGIDDARDLIARQINEIDEEKERLERAVKALSGANGRKPKGARTPSASTQPRRKAPRKRAKRGQRRDEVLDVIRKQPGIKVSEIAKKIGAPASQVHGIGAALVAAEKATKEGARFMIAPATAAAKANKGKGAKAGKAKGRKTAFPKTKEKASAKA